MLEFSKKTNQLMQSKYKYQLQEVEEPNLYREIFDYEAIPKIAFRSFYGISRHSKRGRRSGVVFRLCGRFRK